MVEGIGGGEGIAMSLFSQLVDRATEDEKYSLSSCLMFARRLALKLANDPFRQWVEAEVNGYSPTDPLSEYRRVRPDPIIVEWFILHTCLERQAGRQYLREERVR